jgi:hypothetical protein
LPANIFHCQSLPVAATLVSFAQVVQLAYLTAACCQGSFLPATAAFVLFFFGLPAQQWCVRPSRGSVYCYLMLQQQGAVWWVSSSFSKSETGNLFMLPNVGGDMGICTNHSTNQGIVFDANEGLCKHQFYFSALCNWRIEFKPIIGPEQAACWSHVFW